MFASLMHASLLLYYILLADGFAAWAATVPDLPFPVRYELTPMSGTLLFSYNNPFSDYLFSFLLL